MVRFWLRKLARQFRRSTPVAGKATGQKRGSRPAPRLELLEDRITPSTLDFVGGVLSYTASSGIVNNFTLSLSGSTYTLNDTGETITLTDAAKAAGYTGSGTNTVTGPNSSALTSITVSLGDLADTANIRSTAKPTLVNTGDGNDTINVSSTGLTGNLNGITAPLTIDGGAGANILNVSDYTATTGNQNVVIGSTSITGFAGPTDNVAINYQATGGTYSLLHVLGSNTPSLSQTFTVNNPNTSLLQLNTDNGTNTVNVQAISGPVSIVGGLGKDNIVVCSTSDLSGNLDNINGALTIDGGQGVNTLTVSDAGTTGPANNAVITSSQITGFAGANNDQTISYKAIGGSFSQIHLIGASSASLADQFTVNSPNGPFVLDAGAGNNIVNVQALHIRSHDQRQRGRRHHQRFVRCPDQPGRPEQHQRHADRRWWLRNQHPVRQRLRPNQPDGQCHRHAHHDHRLRRLVQGDDHQLRRRDIQQCCPERVQYLGGHFHRVRQHECGASGQRRQRHVQAERRCHRPEHRRRRRHGHAELQRLHDQRQRDAGCVVQRQRLPEQQRHRPQQWFR